MLGVSVCADEGGGGGIAVFRVPTTQGKHREFCLNTRKTQGILLAQVVNVLILKVKDIAKVAAKDFFPEDG